jgi:hypothetical protein
MGVNAGCDPQLHVRRGQTLRMQSVESVEFVETVDDDVAHTRTFLNVGTSGEGHLQFLEALVVAVEDASIRRDSGVESHEELTPRGHVEQETFFVDEASHRRTQDSLRRIDDSIDSEGRDRFTTPCSQVCLVVDEQWCAEPFSEIPYRTSSDQQ